MSLNQLTVKQLKELLSMRKREHKIKGYTKMRREQLLQAIDSWFTINGNVMRPREHVGAGNKNAGYVRRMEAEKRIIFDRIGGKGPSQWMINKYGQPVQVQEIHQEPVPEPAIFQENENVDFNVGRERLKRTKKRVPTEVEEERQERLRQAEEERRENLREEYQSLKKQVTDCRRKLQVESTKYNDNLDVARSSRISRKKKDELEEKIVEKHRSNVQKIKDQYADLYEYIRTHNLDEDDLNAVHIHLRRKINNL
jgi:uncharacterized membrane protein YqiK